MPSPTDDISYLAGTGGRFGRRLKTLACGRAVYEFIGARRDVITLTRERRIDVYRWLVDGAAIPAWWPGWPGE